MENKNIKIAFILRCHKNSMQINKLTKKLTEAENTEVFIHLDKKSLNLSSEIIINERIHLLLPANAVDVVWGGYSQCRATLNLIKAVIDADKNYDFVVLLSGQDYPIKSIGRFVEYMSSHKDEIFMEFVPQNAPNYGGYDARNDIFYPNFLTGRTKPVRIARKTYSTVLSALHIHRKRIFPKLYYGSSWWAIPGECAEEIYNYCSNDGNVEKYFSHSMCSDECLFQTLAMKLFPDRKYNRKLTFTDWSTNQNSPKTLSVSDLDKVVSADCKYYFARKIDEEQEPNILSLIDKLVTDRSL